ncbi:glycosyltransferase [candidate division KSB1 bacterium]|nr:glycosyltransferase [candidate division KSB1 bacterium]
MYVSQTISVRLSVIIVTYNNADEIEACLAALRDATQQFPTQVILIDNASQDNTREILHTMSPLFSNIRLIFNDRNAGFTKSVNQGLHVAGGDYILLVNPDTVLSENTFPILFSELRARDDIGVIAPQFRYSDGSIQPSCRRFPRHRDVLFHLFGLHILFPKSALFNGWKMGDFDHCHELLVDQPQGAFLLVKRGAYQQIGLLDESFPMFFSDVDWCRRFVDQGWKILFTPKISIIHHKGRSIYSNRIPLIWSSHKSFIRYFQKYYRGGFRTLLNSVTAIALLIMAGLRIVFNYVIQKMNRF